MNALSFVALAHLGAKPLEPFGKGSNALKAGTRDAGPSGPTEPRASTRHGRPFSPRPGSSGKTGLIRGRSEKASKSTLAQGAGGGLDQPRKPHRESDAFAYLPVVGAGQ